MNHHFVTHTNGDTVLYNTKWFLILLLLLFFCIPRPGFIIFERGVWQHSMILSPWSFAVRNNGASPRKVRNWKFTRIGDLLLHCRLVALFVGATISYEHFAKCCNEVRRVFMMFDTNRREGITRTRRRSSIGRRWFVIGHREVKRLANNILFEISKCETNWRGHTRWRSGI